MLGAQSFFSACGVGGVFSEFVYFTNDIVWEFGW